MILVLSEEILLEYEEVLAYKEIKDKIQDKDLEIITTLRELRSMSSLVIPTEKLDAIKEDPDDNEVLECAFAGKVDFIISQDNHLLNLREFRGIKILSPRDFLKMFF